MRHEVACNNNPEAGDVIEGTGGLRKVRYTDEKRGKGKLGVSMVTNHDGTND